MTVFVHFVEWTGESLCVRVGSGVGSAAVEEHAQQAAPVHGGVGAQGAGGGALGPRGAQIRTTPTNSNES